MKLLLVNPNSFQSQGANRIRYYPMNYAYLSAYLKPLGHQVDMIDALWQDYSPRTVVDIILSEGDAYDYIGLGGQINYYRFVKEFAGIYRTRKGRARLLLGGPMTFGLEKQLPLLIPEVDFIVLGEALDTVASLFEAHDCGNDCHQLGKIKGLVFRDDGRVVDTGYPVEKKIDALPLPDWSLADYRQYLKGSYLHGGRLSAHVIAGRGCPFNCTYCSAHFNGLRLRSVENVIKEIDQLREHYGVDDIVFLDETFTYNRVWINAFCEAIKPMGVTWLARTRVDLVDAPMLEKMKAAGCRTINYGIESGSEKILRAMNKRISVEQIEKTIALTRSTGLPFTTNFMIGMPGETMETLKDTLSFLLRNDLRCGFAFTYPLPGTDLFKQLNIKDLDSYLMNITGYFYDRLMINLTRMDDATLLRQKEVIEYTASYHFFRKRFSILTFFFHRFFYIWQARAKENPNLAAPLALIKRLLFRMIARI